MSEIWVAAGIAAVGAGASIYGANKQAKSVKEAGDQNAKLQADQNQSAWNAYLLSRGVNPAGSATGTVPTNSQAVNAKLPLWANANFATGPKAWRKKGSVAPVNTLALGTPALNSAGGGYGREAAPAGPYGGGELVMGGSRSNPFVATDQF